MFLLFPYGFLCKVQLMIFTCLFSHVSFIIYLYCIALWLRFSNSSWNYGVLLICLKADNETEVQRGHYRSRIMQLFRFLVLFFFLLLHTLVFHVHRAGIIAYNSTLYLQGEKCICNTHTHILFDCFDFLIVFWFDFFYPGLICFWLVDCFGLMVFTQPLFIVCS